MEHLEVDVEQETPPPWEEADEPPVWSGPAAGAASHEDTDWVPDAVKDVAYYLRQFKFNEYDRRYVRSSKRCILVAEFKKKYIAALQCFFSQVFNVLQLNFKHKTET